jgi:hypothetical protein
MAEGAAILSPATAKVHSASMIEIKLARRESGQLIFKAE